MEIGDGVSVSRGTSLNYRAAMWWLLAATFFVVTYSAGVWISAETILSTPAEAWTETPRADVYAFAGLPMLLIWCACGVLAVLVEAMAVSVFGWKSPLGVAGRGPSMVMLPPMPIPAGRVRGES